MLKLKKIIVIIFILLLVTSCSHSEKNQPIKSSYNGMGTIIDFMVFGDQGEQAIEKGREIVQDLEEKMSLNIKNSEVNAINDQAGIGPVKVSDDTFQVISKGLYFSQLTEGIFDITIAPITELWNIGNEGERVPTEEEIKEKLSLVNYKNVILNKEKKVFF